MGGQLLTLCLLRCCHVVDFRDMISQEFEKDDDSNGHIDYIVATAVSLPTWPFNYLLVVDCWAS